MTAITSAGNGYYNYYHVKGRYETTDGKAKAAWYDRDLSKEEIGANNASTLDRNYQGADLCRKIADAYRGVAEANRAKYATAQEATDAIWAKYNSRDYCCAYTREERQAMARNEVQMTLYGTVQLGDIWNDPHLQGEVSQNAHNGTDEVEARNFNIKTLEAQFQNLWANNNINAARLSGGNFAFSVNGMDLQAAVVLLDGQAGRDDGLLGQMAAALNSKNNAANLFHNMLTDANKRGLLPSDGFAKYRLFSDFKSVTGLDIRNFAQTATGFVDDEGRDATDVYAEALKTTDKVPAQFKDAANDYFQTLVADALRYDLATVPDLELRMEYRDGKVYLSGDKPHVDVQA